MNKIFAVGIGPGSAEFLTQQARAALEEADLLCGYTTYLDLVRDLFPDKPRYATPMTKERDRCLYALEQAAQGRTVAMVCSGDAGVYGMASLLLELAPGFPGVLVEVVPGVTAALSGAAVLGAPLGHDFCAVSLSDRLTPWAQIETRLALAAEAGFLLCLYNPASRGRSDALRRACNVLLTKLPPETVCGWVRNIGRPGQESRILPLSALRQEALDMFTTVFIGNATTRCIAGRMVTPRGYRGPEGAARP